MIGARRTWESAAELTALVEQLGIEIVPFAEPQIAAALDAYARYGKGVHPKARLNLGDGVGSAFLCAALELTPELRPDHAQYLSHWLAVLKSDARAIFHIAVQAQRAADFLHGLQPDAAPQLAAQGYESGLTR